VNEPSAFNVNDPCAGPETKTALNASPSTSLSLASTPAAAFLLSATSSLVL
jgi:hypothetical protein